MISWTDVDPVEGAECVIEGLTTISLVHNLHSKEWIISANPNIFNSDHIPLVAKDLESAKREVLCRVRSLLNHIVSQLEKNISILDHEHCDEDKKPGFYY